MPFLLLLRHADAHPGHPDHARPLTPTGHRAARAVATHLSEQGPRPDLVLCSPALRARQTLDALRGALDARAETRVEEQLYQATADDLLDRLRQVTADVGAVLVVGHNPALQDLAVSLAASGADRRRLASFPAATLATLTVGGWAGLGPAGTRLTGLHTGTSYG